MATVRKVAGRGGVVDTSTVEDGEPVALKLWTEGEESSLDQLQREANVLMQVAEKQGEIPCPRLYDVIGSPLVTGLVMEWCPQDLYRWWSGVLIEPDAFGRLMATMAEIARRISDYHVFFVEDAALAAHGDIKPSNILLAMDGRWLISDFGTAQVGAPDDSTWDDTRKVVSENFVAPEVLFQAKKRHPAAIDTWSLGATVFALLRLRRLKVDGAEIPRNGTHSPRFRSERVNGMYQLYAKDPKRFRGRDLDPDAFHSPLRLPEEDRRAVREALAGWLPTSAAEEELAEELLLVLDRTMSIDPAHRFTSCRDLAAAFENLTRKYIQLSATDTPPIAPIRESTEAIMRDRDAEVIRAERLARENQRLQEQIDQLLAKLDARGQQSGGKLERIVLIAVVALQLATLVALGVVSLATVLLAVVAFS